MERAKSETDRYAQLRQHYYDQLSRYKSANAELADVAWTLAELEQQIANLEGDFERTNDERIAHRLRDLRRWRGSLEETVLRNMYRAEALLAEVTQLRQELDAAAQS
ncbi:hypothetical protein OSCT_2450 [Oscillochloris trichoides DG-6]|uniref:Uncharacterized protein n=1 Tax=Oscillochloris trichoides DG-6 TaxID=765420 RepID=E1IGJ9_9CHLR|nr:hypothetical protein [Oscillochloris trichoides]EFO79668.1 hypothetical protein OSCT_2450 [Oscillochloris trichoides DG-6]